MVGYNTWDLLPELPWANPTRKLKRRSADQLDALDVELRGTRPTHMRKVRDLPLAGPPLAKMAPLGPGSWLRHGDGFVMHMAVVRAKPRERADLPAWFNRKLDDKSLGFRVPRAPTWKQEIAGFRPWVGERGPPCLFDQCHSG